MSAEWSSTTVLCCLVLCSAALAQITINAGDVPQTFGHEFHYKSAGREGATVNVGPPGGPQTWTFDTSTYVGSPRLITGVDPSGTPFGDRFPAASYATSDPMGPFTMYVYQKITPDEVLGLGYGLDGGSQTRVGVAVPPALQLDLPATLGTAWTSVSAMSDTSGDTVKVDIQDWRCEFDAWGTAVTPCGSWPCLRLNQVELFLQNRYVGGSLVQSDSAWTRLYLWHARGVGWVGRTQSQRGDTSRQYTNAGNYWTLVRTTAGGVGELPGGPAVSPLSISPNPCPGRTTLRCASELSGTALVKVCDAAGRLVLCRTCPGERLASGLELDLRDLPAGVYHCTVTAGGRTMTRQLLRT